MAIQNVEMLTAGETADLQNALIGQKNLILATIGVAEAARMAAPLEEAARLMDAMEPVWAAVCYQYKTREVRARIAESAEAIAEDINGRLKRIRRKDSRAAVACLVELDRLARLAS